MVLMLVMRMKPSMLEHNVTQHSKEDKAYFVQRKGGCGNPFRKTKLCKEYGDGKNITLAEVQARV